LEGWVWEEFARRSPDPVAQAGQFRRRAVSSAAELFVLFGGTTESPAVMQESENGHWPGHANHPLL